MRNVAVGAVLVLTGALTALTGCTSQTTCYGVEPDGEVEKLRPCPEGWKDNETRQIGEDQFKHLEVVDLKSNKKSKGTTTVTVKTTAKPIPTKR